MKVKEGLVPAAVPALLALGAVVVLSIGLLVIDIVRDQVTEARTNELVDNSLRSVTLVDDLRREVHVLAAEPVGRGLLATVVARIARDAAAYDPLATYAGERAEWTHLQGQLERLQGLQAAAVSVVDPGLLRDIEASLDRIVQINQLEAANNLERIRASYRQDVTIDTLGGALMLVLAAIIGIALLRSIRRQRALLAAHLELKDERQRELEAFAGRVAHDLRGPLGPIRGYADLLRLGGAPPPEVLGQRIANATDRMTALIDDLLTLSISGRPAAGQAEVGPTVAQVLEDLGPLLADAKVELAVADGKVRCSAGMLGRIVQNLVSNAIKFRAPERPLELGITASPRDAAVELVVSDNGLGMDEATAAHAFEPLFRAAATRAIPGHGLGLAIVKRTVDALGGSCSITSRPGEGTRITVLLPA